MADAVLNAVVKLSDRMSKPLKGLNKQLRDMQRPFNSLSGQIRQLDRLSGFQGLRQGLGGVARIVGRGGVIGGTALAGGLSALAKGVVDISAQFEKYEAILTSIEGSNEKANKSMAWVQEFATKTPFQLDGVMDAFVSLKTFGLDPMDGTMQALTDSSAKMGGNQEHLKGIILAVGQAWTKGKIQGEEALQLIERGIPVWDLLAEASGRTAVEMQEMATKGRLGRDAIKQLINAMGRNSAGASEEQMKTWNGMMSNLIDQWDRFKLLVGRSGIFEVLSANLKRLLATVDQMATNGKLKELAQTISDMMVSGFETGKAFAKQMIPAIKNFAQWVKAVSPRVASFVEAIGGMKTVAIAVAAVIAGPLLLAVTTLGRALLFTPVGLALTATAVGIGVLVKAATALKDNWEPIMKWFSDTWQSISNTVAELWRTIEKVLNTKVSDLFSNNADSSNGSRPGQQSINEDTSPLALANKMGSSQKGRRGMSYSNANNQVSGRIEVDITSEGQPRVRNVRSGNPNVALDVNAGMSLVGQ